MLNVPEGTQARYLGEGCYRIAYGLYTEEGPLPYVLKVDRNCSRASLDSPKVFYPWGLGRPGCDTEVQVYKRVKERAPQLLTHLAAIHAHGPGWSVQQRVWDVGVGYGDHASDIRALAMALWNHAGVHVQDLGGLNLGRGEEGQLVILDYACVTL